MLRPLTTREHEILSLVAKGLSNRDIARKLYISLGTVKTHTHNIYQKLGVSNRTQALLEAEQSGLLSDDASTPSAQSQAAPPRTNLPASLTPLIGRETELKQIAMMLADDRMRLVTLSGIGGMGKTSLAVEAARQHVDAFADGVFLVSLAHVPDEKNIAAAVLDDMGLAFKGRGEPAQQLLSFLQNKHLLLVMDNFEHLPGGTGLLTDILTAAPGVKILATSRERLNISAEVVYVLGGLGYDVAGPDSSRPPAAALLLERARFVSPTFEPQPEDWPHVQRICELTQGMPLALILAAGWLDVLTLAEIADELGQSIDILESQLSDLPPRQSSMRAAIGHSWRRLSAEEQEAFIRLCVFRGGFSREAAETVAEIGLRTLQSLVNRSFITVEDRRYAIHELLRQFGREHIRQLSNADALHRAHAAYYLTWLANLEGDLKGRRQIDSMREMRRDFGNIQVAWRWAVRAGQTDVIDRPLEALYVFAYISGRVAEGIDLLHTALEAWEAGDCASPLLISRLRVRYDFLQFFSQIQELERTQIERCVETARQHGDDFETAFALQVLANYTFSSERNFTRAVDLLDESLGMMQAAGDAYYVASIYHQLGYCHSQQNGLDGFLRLTEAAYQTAKQSGNLYRVGAASGNLGAVALGYGRYYDALGYYRESIGVMKEFHALWNLVHQLIALAFTSFLIGELAEAEKAFITGLRYARDTGYQRGLAFAQAVDGFFHAARADYAEAAVCSKQSLTGLHSNPTIRLIAHLAAAMAACGQGDDDAAARHLRAACEISVQLDYMATLTWGLPVLVIQQVRRGKLEQAVTWLALLRTHPLSADGWADHWTLFTEAAEHLKQSLDAPRYDAAWQRGQAFDLADIASAV